MTAQSAASAESPKSTGLAGVDAGETAVACVDQDRLLYRGYEIHDLAENATFEEVAFLLLVGHKPSRSELAAFSQELAAERDIPDKVVGIVRDVAASSHPMDTLRTGISLLSHYDRDVADNSPEANLRKAKRLVAKIPTIIGAAQTAIDNKAFVRPEPGLNHAANLLYVMSGEKPSETYARVMDVSLILYAEHEFNASTFTCRTIASTLSDMHSAVVGGVGALKGPLHGGANEAAMDMLKEIGEPDNVEPFMRNAFATKRKIMGFGHRVYKSGDHRADILWSWGRKLLDEKPQYARWFEMGDRVRKVMLEEKNIHPNVDFPCGMVYFTMGIPVPQYTPIFVASRITGWAAHIMEQHANNKLIRPRSEYVGAPFRPWNG